MIQAAENTVLLTVKTKYIKEFTDIMKMASIQNAASVHLEDLVQVVGEIVSIPKRVTQDRTHYGFSTKDIKVGDIVIFSYQVISDFVIKKEDEDPSYKNLITYQGKEYWQADITRIFAVIRGEDIIMVNGYVMAETFDEDRIFLQPTSKRAKNCKSSKVMHVGKPKEHLPPLSIKRGDTIFFNPLIAQKYQINKKPFIILQQHQVLGRLSKK